MACDWGGEDPCWRFPPLSGELKTFSANSVSVSHCLPVLSPRAPLGRDRRQHLLTLYYECSEVQKGGCMHGLELGTCGTSLGIFFFPGDSVTCACLLPLLLLLRNDNTV